MLLTAKIDWFLRIASHNIRNAFSFLSAYLQIINHIWIKLLLVLTINKSNFGSFLFHRRLDHIHMAELIIYICFMPKNIVLFFMFSLWFIFICTFWNSYNIKKGYTIFSVTKNANFSKSYQMSFDYWNLLNFRPGTNKSSESVQSWPLLLSSLKYEVSLILFIAK